MSDWRLEFEVICENVLVGDANDLERHPDEDTCNCVDGDSCLDMKCSNYYRQNECNDSNCSSHSCCNRRLQMNLEAPIEVRPAGTKGWGCFATAKIKRGTLVKELVGEILSEKEYVRRLSEETNKGHAYIVEIKSKTFLDCTYKGSIARFINHSCEPNCETAIWCVNGRLRVGIFARKEIDINVELSFDYRWEASAKPPTRCYCGTKSCRGFLEVDVENLVPSRRSGRWRPRQDFLTAVKGVSVEEAGRWLLGRRIKVWWEGNQQFFEADVINYSRTTHTHAIKYLIEEGPSEEFLLSDFKDEIIKLGKSSAGLYETELSWQWLDETEAELQIKKKAVSTAPATTEVTATPSVVRQRSSSEQRASPILSVVPSKTFIGETRDRQAHDNSLTSAPSLIIREIILSMDTVTFAADRHFTIHWTEGLDDSNTSHLLTRFKVCTERICRASIRVAPVPNDKERLVIIEGTLTQVEDTLKFLTTMREEAALVQADKKKRCIAELLRSQGDTVTCDWRQSTGTSIKGVDVDLPGWPRLDELPSDLHNLCFKKPSSSVSRDVGIISRYVRAVCEGLISPKTESSFRGSLTLHAVVLLSRYSGTQNESSLSKAQAVTAAAVLLALKSRGQFSAKQVHLVVSGAYQAVTGRRERLMEGDAYTESLVEAALDREQHMLTALFADTYVPDLAAIVAKEIVGTDTGSVSIEKLLTGCVNMSIDVQCGYVSGCAAFPFELSTAACFTIFLAIQSIMVYDSKDSLHSRLMNAVCILSVKSFGLNTGDVISVASAFLKMFSVTDFKSWLELQPPVVGRLAISLEEARARCEVLLTNLVTKECRRRNGDEMIRRVRFPWLSKCSDKHRINCGLVKDVALNNSLDFIENDGRTDVSQLDTHSGSNNIIVGMTSLAKGYWNGTFNDVMQRSLISFSELPLSSRVVLKLWPSEKARSHESKKDVSVGLTGSRGSGISASAMEELQVLQHLSHLLPINTAHPTQHTLLPLGILEVADADEGINGSTSILRLNRFIVTRPMLCTMRSLVSKLHLGVYTDTAANVLRSICRDLMLALQHCLYCGVVFKWIDEDDVFISMRGGTILAGFQGAVITPLRTPIPSQSTAGKLVKAKKKKFTVASRIATLETASPEVVLGAEASGQSSLWSFAAVCVYVLTGKHLLKACPSDMKKHVQYLYRVVGTPRKMGYDMHIFTRLPLVGEYGAQLLTDTGELTESRARTDKVLQKLMPPELLDVLMRLVASSTSAVPENAVTEIFCRLLELVPEKRPSIEESLQNSFFDVLDGSGRFSELRKDFVSSLIHGNHHFSRSDAFENHETHKRTRPDNYTPEEEGKLRRKMSRFSS